MDLELTVSGENGKHLAAAHLLPDTAALERSRERVALGSGYITAVLGRGGMAMVYEIWNPQLEIFRAVKVINPNCSEISKKRFQTEIKITAKLQHPNIIEIHAVGEWNGLPYIEMDKIEGETLDKVIQARGALHPAAATSIGIMIARALTYAHSHDYTIFGKQYHGVIHRDLKPSNIMVCGSGVVKLMDFGIARPADVSFMTIDESVTGTLQYLSPEQLERKPLDVRTDIYSLGATLYEMVTGEKAFPEESFPQLVAEKTKNRFLPLDMYNIRIPVVLRRLIEKCMQHDPDKRVQTADELLVQLEKIYHSQTTEPSQQVLINFLSAEASQRVVIATRRPVGKIVLAGVGAAAVVGGIALPALVRNRPARHSPPVAASAQPEIPDSSVRSGSIPETTAVPASRPVQQVTPLKAEAAQRTEVRKKSQPSPRTQQSEPFIEALKTKYGSDDLLGIMQREWKAGNHASVLRVYDHMEPSQARTKAAMVYRLRSMQSSGDRRLGEFLLSASVEDAEFHLARARLACNRRNVAEADRHLERALKAPHEFMDYDQLKQEVSFLQAISAGIKFDLSPSEGTYKDALEAWYQLRLAMRSRPDHEYTRRELQERERISKAFRSLQR